MFPVRAHAQKLRENVSDVFGSSYEINFICSILKNIMQKRNGYSLVRPQNCRLLARGARYGWAPIPSYSSAGAMAKCVHSTMFAAIAASSCARRVPGAGLRAAGVSCVHIINVSERVRARARARARARVR